MFTPRRAGRFSIWQLVSVQCNAMPQMNKNNPMIQVEWMGIRLMEHRVVNTSFAASCSSPSHGIVHLLPKELDEKVVKLPTCISDGTLATESPASGQPVMFSVGQVETRESSAWSRGSEPVFLLERLFRSFQELFHEGS